MNKIRYPTEYLSEFLDHRITIESDVTSRHHWSMKVLLTAIKERNLETGKKTHGLHVIYKYE